jgi:hypothetical protein
VASESSEVLFSFLTIQVSASGAISFLIATTVAVLWIGMAWRVLR